MRPYFNWTATMTHGRHKNPVSRTRRSATLAAIAVLPLLLAGCARGSYAVEVFPEQHYQQTYKRQEPPRLAPPEGAVPVTGREVPLSFEAAGAAKNPVTADTATMTRAAEVFRVNCSMCHGPAGKGDGAVGGRLQANGYVRPPDLTSPATQSKSDGQIFYIVSNGVVVMPKFSLLLNEHDRWSMVSYIRWLANPGSAPAPAAAPTPTPAPAGGH
jgi:mono/diheme cytochrome c family protein